MKNNFTKILSSSIKPVKFSEYEDAYEIAVVPEILEVLLNNNCVVLGGDILTKDMKYNYDNWYYEPLEDVDYLTNVKRSYEKANDYIVKYIEKNGVNYFVVLVVTRLERDKG